MVVSTTLPHYAWAKKAPSAPVYDPNTYTTCSGTADTDTCSRFDIGKAEADLNGVADGAGTMLKDAMSEANPDVATPGMATVADRNLLAAYLADAEKAFSGMSAGASDSAVTGAEEEAAAGGGMGGLVSTAGGLVTSSGLGGVAQEEAMARFEKMTSKEGRIEIKAAKQAAKLTRDAKKAERLAKKGKGVAAATDALPDASGGAGATAAAAGTAGGWLAKKSKVNANGKGLSNGGKVAIGAAAVVAIGTAIGLGVANGKQMKNGKAKYGCPSGYKLKKKFMGKVDNAKAWSCAGPCASSISATIDGQPVTLSGGKKKFLSKKCKFSFVGAVAEE